MADLTDNERDRIAEEMAAELTKADSAKSIAPDDLKEIFCKYWPKVKRILEKLLPKLPPEIQAALKTAIGILDRIHDLVCG